MYVDASGRLQAKASKADETRKRLAAAQDRVAETSMPTLVAGGDVMTAEEVAAAFSKKGKKVCSLVLWVWHACQLVADITACCAARPAAEHGTTTNCHGRVLSCLLHMCWAARLALVLWELEAWLRGLLSSSV